MVFETRIEINNGVQLVPLNFNYSSWFFLLKNASRIKEEEIKKLKEDPIFNMALERLERLSSDPKTRKAYEESINEQRNLTAIQEASIEEGREAGRKEGEEKGRKEGSFSIAKKLLKKGMPIEEVAAMTDLAIEDLRILEKAKT